MGRPRARIYRVLALLFGCRPSPSRGDVDLDAEQRGELLVLVEKMARTGRGWVAGRGDQGQRIDAPEGEQQRWIFVKSSAHSIKSGGGVPARHGPLAARAGRGDLARL